MLKQHEMLPFFLLFLRIVSGDWRFGTVLPVLGAHFRMVLSCELMFPKSPLVGSLLVMLKQRKMLSFFFLFLFLFDPGPFVLFFLGKVLDILVFSRCNFAWNLLGSFPW